ncbi:hypothetical protein P20652_3312 [Pseudoalteromonas sp. BSi20652]|nr:hypothetical protein P20652_3312 [Pseudoalteromonas sp. BSi20652]
MLTGILVFVMGCLILLYFAGNKLATTINTDTEHVIKHLDAAVLETNQILAPLNKLNFTRCDDLNLIEMRRALFDAKYVIDIGFFENDKLVCTTGVGLLKNPIADKEPDFIRSGSNTKVRFDPKLPLLLFNDREMQVVIVRQNNYNLIMLTAVFDDGIVTAPYWQVIHKAGNKLNHLVGTDGLYEEITNRHYLPFETRLECSDASTGYCVAVHIPWSQFFADNQLLLIISLILNCLAGISSALVVDFQISARRSTRVRVRKGLKKGSFYWTYQPIICLQTGKAIGCEVLARFKDKYGALLPDQFIALIRKNHLTWSFTEVMISKVVEELTKLEVLPEGFKVSLNIFPCDVEKGNVSLLAQMPALINSRFTICLEITEDEYLDTEIAHTHFRTLVKSGFNLSLDDFGTGYSNLKNLQNLSFHQLKIDRAFVQDIATEGLKASMIPNIMELVHKFNYTCVAEGIETIEQEAILKMAGAHYGQGWRYGRPMTVDNFKEYLTTQTL